MVDFSLLSMCHVYHSTVSAGVLQRALDGASALVDWNI